MLARELGLNLEMADVECDSLLPAGLANWQPDAKSDKSLTDQLVEALQLIGLPAELWLPQRAVLPHEGVREGVEEVVAPGAQRIEVQVQEAEVQEDASSGSGSSQPQYR